MISNLPESDEATMSVAKARTSKRVRWNRDELLLKTARLFGQRGFEQVGMDLVGQTIGVTGAALYRYFPSKRAILEAVYDHIGEDLEAAVRAAARVVPHERLERLIEHQIAISFKEGELTKMYVTEERHLGPEMRAQVRKSLKRYVAAWSEALNVHRPDLSTEQRRAAAYAVILMINSVGYQRRTLPEEELVEQLRNMGYAALMSSKW
jgi:AcrR family transcriptional regulator